MSTTSSESGTSSVWNAVAVEDIKAGQYVHMVKESDDLFVVRLRAVQPTRWMVERVSGTDPHQYQSRVHDCDVEGCRIVPSCGPNQ